MKDLISIIVPVYNVEDYLERCIESILKQTYDDLEIILINDGSSDGSLKICKDYENKDPRIVLVNQENKGVSYARNIGLEICKGQYIMFVDSDDHISARTVQELLNDINTYEADMSICSFLKVFDDSDIVIDEYNNTTLKLNSEKALSLLLDDHELCVPWGKLYKATLFSHLRFDTEKYNEDMFTIHQLFDACNNIALSNNPLYYYNQKGVSLTRSRFNYKKLDMVEAIDVWYIFMKEHYPSLSEKAKIKYLSILVNTCTHLYNKSDKFGRGVYLNYSNIISKNYYTYIKSSYPRFNDKIKATLILLRLYKGVLKLKSFADSNVRCKV